MTERVKKCIICGSRFTIITNLRAQDKTCSTECRYKNKLAISRRHSRVKTIKICSSCHRQFLVTKKYKTGTGKCKDCISIGYSKDRIGKGNPAYRNGLRVLGKPSIYTSRHLRACNEYRRWFLTQNNFLHCEICKVNELGAKRFEVHHIYYASRFPHHKKLHDHRNMILACIQCHNDFHSGKSLSIFRELEKQRELKELFNI
jgi:hypothetical protein